MPQDAYGWEKLVTERLCTHFREDFGLETRIVRFHNIFGPYGTWTGGREKAPAAMCRKVAIAKLTGNHEIEIWGDGEQTRSFCYIDDCVLGIFKLMQSDYREPLNLGQDRLVTINQLADMAAAAAGIRITKRHIEGPQGVRGRNSDNTRLRQILDWEPAISLEEGLARTYRWIEEQVQRCRDRRDGSVRRFIDSSVHLSHLRLPRVRIARRLPAREYQPMLVARQTFLRQVVASLRRADAGCVAYSFPIGFAGLQ